MQAHIWWEHLALHFAVQHSFGTGNRYSMVAYAHKGVMLFSGTTTRAYDAVMIVCSFMCG